MNLKANKESGKIITNASWLIGCRIAQMVLSFVIGTLSARYLGPSNYGAIGYAGAIVTFMVPVIQLGIRSTLVHELVSAPDREGEILGTSLCMSAAASLLGILGVFAFTSIANRDEPVTILVCVLYSVSLVFQATEMIQYWFQAHLKSKYVAIVSLISYTVVSAYRVFLLISKKSVFWFAMSQALDFFLISILLLVIYRKIGGDPLRVSLRTGRDLYSRSRYYIVSGIMVTFFSLTDRVMITLMLGEAANGYYTAAVTIADLSRFVFAAIIDSVRPSVFEARKKRDPSYERRLSRLFSIIIGLALLQSIVLLIGAPLIVRIIYGRAYLAAIPALQIITWYTAFAYTGSVRNIWILAEQKQQMLWKINLCGALLNIVMNLCLIPKLGINGAAVASVAAQFFINFALCFLLRPLRPVARIMMDGINPFGLRQLWSARLDMPENETDEAEIKVKEERSQ